jgi:uncharacterized protein YbbC (DUF1343 family)
MSFGSQVMKLCRAPQSCFVLLLLCCSRPDPQLADLLPQEDREGFGPVRPGIEVLLEDSIHLVSGRRVGLITNQTGVDASGRSTIDRLHEHPGVDLVALFAPEHGIRGTADPGELIADDVDRDTRLPIHSLYGSVRTPTPAMLDEVDVLLVDLQDIGARYWTYPSTMTLAMEATAEHGIPIVILDRPNPIGGAVQGNVLDAAFGTFVGRYPIAMRHGMTLGELARYYQSEAGIGGELHVAPVDGWHRELSFAETGLPWIRPSPNMPDVESATHYPGTCLFEGTVLSVARGTDAPFQQIGAPWLDGEALAARMNGYGLPGVRFEPVEFVPESPSDGKFDGVAVQGVRLVATSAEYDPTHAAIALLVETHRMSGARWGWLDAHFDRLAGTDLLRQAIEAGAGVDEIRSGWREELAVFTQVREQYLIYP